MAPQHHPSKRVRTYKCSRCGFPKKGHVCAAAGGRAGEELVPDLPVDGGSDETMQDLPPPETDDRISALPDDVLRAVIALLPADDGARTQCLSTRWHPLWRSAALNLDDDDVPCVENHNACFEDDLVGVISCILATHRGPIRRLSLTNLYRVSEFRGDRSAIFDAWFQDPKLDNLEELHLRYRRNGTAPDPLRPSALRFSTVKVASFGCCHLPDDLEGITFPNLQQLTLEAITNSEDTLHAMILACPDLRSLLLRDNDQFRRVAISSQNLVSIGLTCTYDHELEELSIVDAPSLEKLLIFKPDMGPREIHVVSAPKLEVLGCLSDFLYNDELGTVFQQGLTVDSTAVLHNVKILAISLGEPSLSAVISILSRFPCLQKLYITLAEGGFYDPEIYYGPVDTTASIDCLDLHLKEVVVRNYRGQNPYIAFAKYFVSNAKVLEQMTFRVYMGLRDKWLPQRRQRRLICWGKRASPGARIRFSRDDFFENYYHMHRTHHLSAADPFDNTFCDCC